jgi:hypothetical protein
VLGQRSIVLPLVSAVVYLRDIVLAGATMLGRPIVRLWGGGSEAHATPAASPTRPEAGAGLDVLVEGVRRPVEVRLPAGLLLVLVLAAAGLLIGVYQIGQHTGSAPIAGRTLPQPGPVEADTQSADGVAEDSWRDATVVARGTLPERGQLEPRDVPGGAVITPAKDVLRWLPISDPRIAGLNYFNLVTVAPSEVEGVRQLQRFLAEHRVATFLDTANNGRLRVLVDVTRGFSRQDLDTLEYAEHRHRIQALGKQFQRLNHGMGTDLSDLYLDRFDGPPGPGNP